MTVVQRLLMYSVAVVMAQCRPTKPTDRSTPFDSAHLEQIMFADELDALEYKTNCGADWHRLFAGWEQRQRSAIDREPGVKVIVWRCRQLCGGLGDRQRGILTSFTLALATNRAFFIDSEDPVPLQHFFHVANPGLHWTFDDSLLDGRDHMEEDFMNGLPAIGDFSTANLSYYDDYDVVIQHNNFWRPLNVLRNPSLRSVRLFQSFEDHVLAGCMLNYLLVPAHDLQMQVHHSRTNATKENRYVLALQVRTGDSQSKNDTVLERVVQYFEDCADRIQRASRKTFRIFLTTDSVGVVDRFAALHPDMSMFHGPIVHIDGAFGSADSPETAFRKVVLDHMMISKANTLILSRSGFGEFAAMRGFKPYYTPLMCTVGNPIPHYSFPSEEPQGVPATNINSVEDVFMNSHAVSH